MTSVATIKGIGIDALVFSVVHIDSSDIIAYVQKLQGRTSYSRDANVLALVRRVHYFESWTSFLEHALSLAPLHAYVHGSPSWLDMGQTLGASYPDPETDPPARCRKVCNPFALTLELCSS